MIMINEDIEDKKSPSRVDEEQEEDDIESMKHNKCGSVNESLPMTVKDKI